MWDGRQTFPRQPIHFDLSDQANGATLGHAAAINPLTQAQREAIVNFERGLFTAQSTDNAAGVLNSRGGNGGPLTLSRQSFYIGINDVLSPGFNQRAFTLFDAWRNLASSDGDPFTDARAAVARGQEIFNTRGFSPRSERCARRRCASGYVHKLSRHTERPQPFDVSPARPRVDHCRCSNTRHAALHVPKQHDRRSHSDDGSRPCVDHRQVGAYVIVQGTYSAGFGRACSLLSQRISGDAGRGGRVLQQAL